MLKAQHVLLPDDTFVLSIFSVLVIGDSGWSQRDERILSFHPLRSDMRPRPGTALPPSSLRAYARRHLRPNELWICRMFRRCLGCARSKVCRATLLHL